MYNKIMNKVAIFGKKGSIAKFDLSDNKAIWIGDLADGYTPSSIIQYYDYVIVFSSTAFTGKTMLHCFNEIDGELLWSHESKYLFNNGHPFYPSILENCAYFTSSSKEVAKLDLNTGELIFKKKFDKPLFRSYKLAIISNDIFLISNKDALLVNKDTGDVIPYPEIENSLNLKDISTLLGNGTSFTSSISTANPSHNGDGSTVIMSGGDGGGAGGGE